MAFPAIYESLEKKSRTASRVPRIEFNSHFGLFIQGELKGAFTESDFNDSPRKIAEKTMALSVNSSQHICGIVTVDSGCPTLDFAHSHAIISPFIHPRTNYADFCTFPYSHVHDVAEKRREIEAPDSKTRPGARQFRHPRPRFRAIAARKGLMKSVSKGLGSLMDERFVIGRT